MKTTNIRELKHATSTVLGWVADGETVEITRRNEVVGVIVPPAAGAAGKTRKADLPDFYERLQELFYDRARQMTGTELVSYARGER